MVYRTIVKSLSVCKDILPKNKRREKLWHGRILPNEVPFLRMLLDDFLKQAATDIITILT